MHHNKAPGPKDGPRTSPEQPEAGGCELAHSRKSTGPEGTSNYACVSRARREQQIALIWDTQGKHSWLKLSTTFDATEYSPPWLAKALPRIFNPSHTSCTSSFTRPFYFNVGFSLPRHQQVSSSPQSHGLHSRAPRTGSRLGRALPHSSHATRPPRPAPLLSPRAPRACEQGPRFTLRLRASTCTRPAPAGFYLHTWAATPAPYHKRSRDLATRIGPHGPASRGPASPGHTARIFDPRPRPARLAPDGLRASSSRHGACGLRRS